MPLTSFGSILGFSEDLETQDMAFYAGVLANPECADLAPLIEPFIKDGKKFIALIQRTRRENVTEMILEPIRDFERSSFLMEEMDAAGMTLSQVKDTMKKMEERAIDYYTQAAGKIRALPEVSNAMKQLAKKHKARLNKIIE